MAVDPVHSQTKLMAYGKEKSNIELNLNKEHVSAIHATLCVRWSVIYGLVKLKGWIVGCWFDGSIT